MTMQYFNLCGDWSLRQDNSPELLKGQLPGSSYLDLMANGKLEDPFWGMNEDISKDVAHHDYEYSRDFTLTREFLQASHVELAASGLDTLATVRINGTVIGEADNINRIWRFDAKPYLREGTNSIQILLKNPFPYVEERQANQPLKGMDKRSAANAHLRKTPSHFGWDWGPSLPPAGLTGVIRLESYELRLKDVHIIQHHEQDKVRLEVTAQLSGEVDNNLSADCSITTPEGKRSSYPVTLQEEMLHCSVLIEDPQLWWCNGLGAQPLYIIELAAANYDKCVKTVGLRTIKLDTSPDGWGNQFRFEVNGVPVFAKGANWIPSDSFVTRTSFETLEFYIRSAKRANMNMLRVWGGGRYESDEFYELCDRYGILVWQDFIFACSSYPLYDPEFLENVRQEVIDNVTRLRHHASLALWNGNNENELFRMFWKKGSEIYESNMNFYHKLLPEWVAKLDGGTPYWPGSPSSGSLEYKTHDMNRGDTHLWQIWHGMLPVEAFRRYPTRFCSEFGMESMPSMHTIRSFTDQSNLKLFDPVMQLHQKSVGGNEKMLFYLLAKYRNPKHFEDFIYLSQLVQSDTIRFASERWRRGMGRHNGALYWQYNDCWPVASWASIDYGRQYKALQYHAEHFNKLLCISNDYFEDRAELYIINEYPDAFQGNLKWELTTFEGTPVSEGAIPAVVEKLSAKKTATLHFSEILKGHSKKTVVLRTVLLRDEQVLDEKNYLLVPDRKAALPKPRISRSYKMERDILNVTLKSDVYARSVCLDGGGLTEPWSDNYFDLLPGREKKIWITIPQGTDAEDAANHLRVKSLAEVEPNNSLLTDRWLRFILRFKKNNFLTWIIFKILL